MENPPAYDLGTLWPGVPVFVMLPLDSVTQKNTVHMPGKTMVHLQALQSIGVAGVMMDVWWGIVEKEAPGNYQWDAYKELVDLARKCGLKVQAVMSFHECGGNVGDPVNIPLPAWVVEEMKDKHLAYTDQRGERDYEYVSLGCDGLTVLKGRTPVQCYADFMRSFKENFSDLLGGTIVEVHVGMGPAGELRYPSYPLRKSEITRKPLWEFPGIGAFQCYDKYMLFSLKARAAAYGKPEWGQPPNNAGYYKDLPEDTEFFRDGGDWNSPYGQFFLQWYSDMLIDHGQKILAAVAPIFSSTDVKLAMKVAGIHWQYKTGSHAPELTAGYYNTKFRDGYLPIASMLGRHGVILNFTCLEMRDSEQKPPEAKCSPEKLVEQVIGAKKKARVSMGGENALPRFDIAGYIQIFKQSRAAQLRAFTYLRMGEKLFELENWIVFAVFVMVMSRNMAVVESRLEEDIEAMLVTKRLSLQLQNQGLKRT